MYGIPLLTLTARARLAAPAALYCFVASRVEVTLRLLALACLGAQFGCAGSNVDYDLLSAEPSGRLWGVSQRKCAFLSEPDRLAIVSHAGSQPVVVNV